MAVVAVLFAAVRFAAVRLVCFAISIFRKSVSKKNAAQNVRHYSLNMKSTDNATSTLRSISKRIPVS